MPSIVDCGVEDTFCVLLCIPIFNKQCDKQNEQTLCAVNVRHFVLLMLGLRARNSEWNSWYATAIIIIIFAFNHIIYLNKACCNVYMWFLNNYNITN